MHCQHEPVLLRPPELQPDKVASALVRGTGLRGLSEVTLLGAAGRYPCSEEKEAWVGAEVPATIRAP